MIATRMARRLPQALVGLFAALFLAGAGLEFGAKLLPDVALDRLAKSAQIVVDDRGEMLRGYLSADGYWRLPSGRGDISPQMLAMLIAYEDRRFFSHDGIDWLAAARAGWQWLRHGRAVSGASTLTMQVARLIEPAPRNLGAKLRQALRARWLERRFSKDEILAAYLTLAPFGGNIEGIKAAALAYFGKGPERLTIAEAATLIALPQAPERRRPDLHAARAAKARDVVLARLAAAGVITPDVAARARRVGLSGRRRALAGVAPHLADRLRARFPETARIESFIDQGLQAKVRALLARAAPLRQPRVSGAVLVVSNRDAGLRAYVSGTGLGAARAAGHLDLVKAVRSPGSTLKPVIYGLAFERLIVHPKTVITDAPMAYSAYEPRNFSLGYQGDVTVRDALIKSINTTAVAILAKVGPSRLMTRLRKVGVPLAVAESDREAHLSIALGGGGMTLLDLATLYSGLARGGRVLGLRASPAEPLQDHGRLLSVAAAWTVSDILADVGPPDAFSSRHARDGARRIAYKTGTSYGFRDAWSVGYDRDHTVAVWLGRPDGAPTPGLSGLSAAAPLLYRIFDLLKRPGLDVAGPAPGGTLLAKTRGLPKRLLRFASGAATHREIKLEIAFPKDGATLRLSQNVNGRRPEVSLAARGGRPPYYWFVDNKPVGNSATVPEMRWRPDGAGQFQLTVIDATGKTARAGFWLE